MCNPCGFFCCALDCDGGCGCDCPDPACHPPECDCGGKVGADGYCDACGDLVEDAI